MAGWSYGLVRDMKVQAKHIIRSELAVVIRDKYPKARFHFLVLPWADIDTVYQLNRAHIPLLEEMYLLGINTIEVNRANRDDFKMGFHMEPSMHRLHLHVISTDFVSSQLKHKRHWNIFNTDLFMNINDVIAELNSNGVIQQRPKQYIESLLETPLMCNRCGQPCSTMPELKKHLECHSP